MQFFIIDATNRTVKGVQAKEVQSVYKRAGLNVNQIDHGHVAPGVAIVVYEYGLVEPPENHRFFAIGRQLFAGNAVLYAYDVHGTTIDLKQHPPVLFFANAGEVERAIEHGQIDRPEMRVNGALFWQWPEKQRGM